GWRCKREEAQGPEGRCVRQGLRGPGSRVPPGSAGCDRQDTHPERAERGAEGAHREGAPGDRRPPAARQDDAGQAGKVATVVMDGSGYQPALITVKKGES